MVPALTNFMLLNLGVLVGCLAIAGSVIYLAFQIIEARVQMQVDSTRKQTQTRIDWWRHQLSIADLESARDKFFDHELYKQDATFSELEELTLRERRALQTELLIELAYFQNLHYQLSKGLIEANQIRSLIYMRCLTGAPQRRFWKDTARITGNYPDEFISHVDTIVKKYDDVETIMDSDQDADFEAAVQAAFQTPSPPRPSGG